MSSQVCALPVIMESSSESGYNSTNSISDSVLTNSSLISLPYMKDDCTLTEVDLFLLNAEKLISKLELYGSVYSSHLDSHYLSYIELTERLHSIQVIAFNMKSLTHIKKCSTLILQIEESKLEWLLNCPNHLFLSPFKKSCLDTSYDLGNGCGSEVVSLEDNGLIPEISEWSSMQLHDMVAKHESTDSSNHNLKAVCNSIPIAAFEDQLSLSVDNIVSHPDHNIPLVVNSMMDKDRKRNDILSKLLTDELDHLQRLLFPISVDNMSRSSLVDLLNNYIPVVEKQRTAFQLSLRDYIKMELYDAELALSATEVIKASIDWISSIRHLYMSKGLYRKSQSKKLYGKLSKFSTDPNINIYEFFVIFEALTADFDYSHEKAEYLYQKCLVEIHQEEVTRYRHNYEAMKSYLIHKYGDPRLILSSLIQPLFDLELPDNHSNPDFSVSYYRKFQSVLETINSYLDPNSEYLEEFEACISSQEFFLKLLQLVPINAKHDFFKQMDLNHENTLSVKGRKSFEILLDIVRIHYKIHDSISIHDNSAKLKSSNGAKESFNSYPKRIMSANVLKQFPAGEQSFPCVVSGHNHSINQCSEFLNLTVKERVKHRKDSKFKHCAVCLQSSALCNGGNCVNIRSVPKILICKGCKDTNRLIPNRPSYSVLFCLTESHAKPPDFKILKALKEYIPGFRPNVGL